MKVLTGICALFGLVAMLSATQSQVQAKVKKLTSTSTLTSTFASTSTSTSSMSGAAPGVPKRQRPQPGTDDSMWITVRTINGLAGGNGLKVYGGQIWQASGGSQSIEVLDRLTGSLIRSIGLPDLVFLMGVTRFGANNESVAVATFYPGNTIYIGDTLGAWTRHFNAPTGYACRGLDWDGVNFWISDINSPRLYTCSRTGALLHTLTAIGPAAEWFMDICLDRTYPNRLWAIDNSPDAAYYIALDTAANTYQILATFIHPGINNTPEGIGYWSDGMGNACCFTNAYFTSTIWQQWVHQTLRAADVSVTAIIEPEAIAAPGTAVTPSCVVYNYGAAAQSNIPVTCWIDSARSRVYNQTVTYAGPLAPHTSATVTFAPDWTTGAMRDSYTVRMFTALAEDSNRFNDTTGRVVGILTPPCRCFEPEWILPNDGHTIYAACVVQDTLLWVAHGYYAPNRILIYRIRDLALIDSFLTNQDSGYNYIDFYFHASEDVVYAAQPFRIDRWDAMTHAYLGRVPDPVGAFAVSGEGDSLYLSGFDIGIFKCALDGANFHQVALPPPQASAIGLAVDSSRHLLFCTSSYSPPDHLYECDMFTWTWVLDTILLPQASDWGGCELFHGDTFMVAVTQDPDDEVHCYRLIPSHAGVAADNGPLRTADCHLRVAPNPSTGAALISFALPRPGNLSVKLYRVTGAEVMTLATGYHKAGAYSLTPSFSHTLARGVYLLRLETEHSALEQKLILE